MVVGLECSEACTVSLAGTARVVGKDPLVSLQPREIRLPAKQRRRVRLALSREDLETLRELLRRGEQGTAVIRASAVDESGRRSRAARRIALRR